jgi:uroporphyrinogen-III decarboxylase
MMTGMERLTAAINGQAADSIPIFCNLLDQGAKELGLPLEDYYARGEHVAEAQLRMREKYGYDNLWSLFYVGKEAELLGCRKIMFARDGPPNVEDLVIKTYDDIFRLEVPEDLASHPFFQETLRCLRLLRSEAGGKYPICAYLTASMTLPVMLMGMEKWLELLLFGPAEGRDVLLAKCSDFFRKEITAYRNAGADIIIYSNPFGSTDFIPMKLFQTLALEWIVKDLQPVGTEGVVYYCGGARLNPVIGQVLERTGIAAYYLAPRDDITAAKRIIAGRALTGGVINDIKLLDWSEEEIRREVKGIIEAGRPGGKFLFGTLAMPYAIPEESIKALLAAAREFGSCIKRE